MSDFKGRLLVETSELAIKVGKLSSFLESDNPKDVDGVQLTLLNIQLAAMKTYLECLEARINRL